VISAHQATCKNNLYVKRNSDSLISCNNSWRSFGCGVSICLVRIQQIQLIVLPPF
jgi:hypothetical protein